MILEIDSEISGRVSFTLNHPDGHIRASDGGRYIALCRNGELRGEPLTAEGGADFKRKCRAWLKSFEKKSKKRAGIE